MIEIIANIGNKGFALPMVQAYPLDPSSSQMLGWNPLEQALDYVPFAGNAFGDFGVVRDLSVGRDAAIVRNTTIGGTLGVAGSSTLSGGVAVVGAATVSTNLTVTGTSTFTGAATGASTIGVTTGGNNSALNAVQLSFQANKVVGPRQVGWTAATGTATRTTFATGAVTLPVLAEHVKALIDDLVTHGLIGT